jgi:predicted DNA-binding protein (UPF0251 family)
MRGMSRAQTIKVSVAGAIALAIALGTTGAIAASRVLSPTDESRAVIDDAADRLGVEPNELRDALRDALKSRVDAAVEAGRLTEEQGKELKERIDSDDTPLVLGGFGAHGPGHLNHVGHLDAAASYLDISETELRERLAGGETLAEIAKDEGKSVDGLVQAMVGAAEAKLDEAVAEGRLTQVQADEIAGDLEQRMTDFVNGERPERGFGRRFGHGAGRGFGGRGPPAFSGPHA